ncbi:MAG: radical SAM family heme chaperone HemW [Candidatus Loosdrechtia sp.]|uniref:coproporphyrinogen-III oxidase family protein n=1 Tax=Candidatus Loosdrechtia sp. TaxID=3101272 RepID=UPI003A60778D|nr:MAG: radical SAM family heme chaperone HemW [Candidatus Jettenia sp. AMX2]
MISGNNIPPKALYLHIPFCEKKCYYCDFNSIVSDSKTIEHYLEAVDVELRTLTLMPWYTFTTVYIGGGTPSLLSEYYLEKLLRSVVSYIPVSGIKEFTFEANPGSLTMGKARLLKEYQVNRVSLGVQSFQDKQLTFLGRVHSCDDARKTFSLLREAGFTNIAVDLLFGCPDQSLDEWKSDLTNLVELNPEHISTYSLTYEEGTPLTVDLKGGMINKLDEEIELEMYKAAIRYLSSNGYDHYEISNFAKNGYECSHNRVYWENTGYAGIGAGAFSFIDGIRTMNERDIFCYSKGSPADIKSFRESLPPDRLASETVIMSLRLRQGISNTDFIERFGYTLDDRFGDTIHKLIHDGFINYDNERLKLTEKGLFVADSVMAEFL